MEKTDKNSIFYIVVVLKKSTIYCVKTDIEKIRIRVGKMPPDRKYHINIFPSFPPCVYFFA